MKLGTQYQTGQENPMDGGGQPSGVLGKDTLQLVQIAHGSEQCGRVHVGVSD